MKVLFYIHLILLLCADIFLVSFYNTVLQELNLITIAFINLIIGPIQFFSALILLFFEKYNTPRIGSYLLISLITTATFFIGTYGFDYYNHRETFALVMMYFSFLLAHYFVYLLYKLKKDINLSPVKNDSNL